MADDRFWPRPGFPGSHRKQSLAGRAISLKVSFLALPHTHNGGHELPFLSIIRLRFCSPA